MDGYYTNMMIKLKHVKLKVFIANRAHHNIVRLALSELYGRF